MCLLLLAYKLDSRFPFILAANRDEFYARKTQAADFQKEDSRLLMGRDLEAGGTWLGFSKENAFAAVTNAGTIRSYPCKSRGDLPINYLRGQTDPLTYATEVHQQGDQYQGFNLLVGNTESVQFVANREGGVQSLPTGLHGLANGGLNDDCPRIRRIKALFCRLPKVSTESLLHILTDTEIGKLLSNQRSLPCFIAGQTYGTRASTVILVNSEGRVEFTEQTWLAGGVAAEKKAFSFCLNSAAGLRQKM